MAGSKRQWISRHNFSRGGQQWAPLSMNVAFSFQNRGSFPLTCAGTFSNLRCSTQVGLAVGSTRSMTLNKNNVQTSLTCSIVEPATSAADITHTVSAVAGDMISWSGTVAPTAGGNDNLEVTCDFVSDVAGNVPYGHCNGTNYTSSVFAPLFTGVSGSWNTGSVTANDGDYVLMPGTITAWRVATVGSSGGGGKEWVGVLYKNGVRQDGTGGTVDTRISLTGSGATDAGSWAGSLSITTGDLMVVRYEAVNTPNQCMFQTGVCINHTDPNSYNLFAYQGGAIDSTTRYQNLSGTPSWNTTEANYTVLAPLTKMRADAIGVGLAGGAPGAGTSYTISVRRSSASPANTPAAVIANTATSGTDTGAAVFDNTDFFSLQSVASGVPAGRSPRIAIGFTPYWKVPNVVGNGKNAALAAITAQNLTPVENYVNDPVVPVDDVISTDPVADTDLPPADPVTVNISLGPGGGGVGAGGARYAHRYRAGWNY